MTHRSADISQRTVFGVMWIPILAYGAVLTTPAFVAVLGKHFGMSGAELGGLTSAEWAACITGTYLTKNRSIDELRRWVPWACALAMVTNAAAVFLVSHVPLFMFHPLSTFGAGIAYGYVLKVFHASGKQQRNFGIFIATMYLSELVIFQLINYLTERYTTSAVFIVYSALALAALLVANATRASLAGVASPEEASTASEQPGRLGTAVLFSVGAVGVSYVAYGMIWPFVQLMGVTRGFSALDVTNGTSGYAITGIAGALIAAALSPRVNRAVVLGIAMCALLVSIYMLYAAPSYVWFFVGCLIFGFYWTFCLTVQVGIIAKADSTGRGIVLCGVAPSIGAIAGSFLGGQLIQGTNYLPSARVGAVVAVIGMVCTFAAMARMRPTRGLMPVTDMS